MPTSAIKRKKIINFQGVNIIKKPLESEFIRTDSPCLSGHASFLANSAGALVTLHNRPLDQWRIHERHRQSMCCIIIVRIELKPA